MGDGTGVGGGGGCECDGIGWVVAKESNDGWVLDL